MPQPRNELVIFDCDGVLVDSEPHLQAVDLRLIAELGWPITIDEIQAEHLGRSTADVIANIERRTGRPVPDDFAARRRAAYRALIDDDGLVAVPGVEGAIAELVNAGHRISVASSGSPAAIANSLSRTGLAKYFGRHTFSSHQVQDGKPAPDLFLFACRCMQARPEDCVVIEDSPAGVAAARAAGMPVIGFARTTARDLLVHADVTIGRMTELSTAVASL